MGDSCKGLDVYGLQVQGKVTIGYTDSNGNQVAVPATPELFAALGAVGTQTMSYGQGQETPSSTLPSLAALGVSGAMNASLTLAQAAGPPANLPSRPTTPSLNSPTNGIV